MTAEDTVRTEEGWGARLIGPDEALFRLWAPGLDKLRIELAGDVRQMAAKGDGWFELAAGGVAHGTAYRYLLPDGLAVPDPAARAQAGDVHGPSLLVDPAPHEWRHPEWRGRPWEEAVIYEMHVGTFTPQGTFAAAARRLPYLAELGVTAIELMPVAQFAGRRGWGYDGVLLYAPHNAYGSPEELKRFVDAAHGLGLMVLLDVVYNHFGPDGNYLHAYAPEFFHRRRSTPWGDAIAYERPPVRRFFVDNALYWLDEFRFDGLRLDAIDNIVDDRSDEELLVEIACRVRSEITDRHLHLTTEDNRNITRLHERDEAGRVVLYTAEWNDDFHNVAHVAATGEAEGYYEDFAGDPWPMLGRALAEGYVYQGETSAHSGGRPRGEPSAHLPPIAFVDFLQNHDQIGNRPAGERLTALAPPRTLELFRAMLLLSPHVPLLFMGEEYGETAPFLFFTDFTGALADAVREGRRREFAHFSGFGGQSVPDPNALSTFEASRLDWDKGERQPWRGVFQETRRLLALRRRFVVPMLAGTGGNAGTVLHADDGAIAVDWRLAGGRLSLRANFSTAEKAVAAADGTVIHCDPDDEAERTVAGRLPANAIVVTCEPSAR